MEAEAKLKLLMLVEGWTPLLLCVAATHPQHRSGFAHCHFRKKRVGVIRAQL